MAGEPTTKPTPMNGSTWSEYAARVWGASKSALGAGGFIFPGNILVPGLPIANATAKTIVAGADAIKKTTGTVNDAITKTSNAVADTLKSSGKGIKTGFSISIVLIVGLALLFIFGQARALRKEITGG